MTLRVDETHVRLVAENKRDQKFLRDAADGLLGLTPATNLAVSLWKAKRRSEG